MLSNAYFVTKFRFDTAENEPAKKFAKFVNFANFAHPNPLLPPNTGGLPSPPAQAVPPGFSPKKGEESPVRPMVQGSNGAGLRCF